MQFSPRGGTGQNFPRPCVGQFLEKARPQACETAPYGTRIGLQSANLGKQEAMFARTKHRGGGLGSTTAPRNQDAGHKVYLLVYHRGLAAWGRCRGITYSLVPRHLRFFERM